MRARSCVFLSCLAACGNSVELTVVTSRAPLRAEANDNAAVAFEWPRGHVFTGKTPAFTAKIFGGEAYFRVEHDGRTLYLHKDAVRPHPLAATIQFVGAQGAVVRKEPDPKSEASATLLMGDAVETRPALGEAEHVPALEKGAIKGWVAVASLTSEKPSAQAVEAQIGALFASDQIAPAGALARHVVAAGVTIDRAALGVSFCTRVMSSVRSGDLLRAKQMISDAGDAFPLDADMVGIAGVLATLGDSATLPIPAHGPETFLRTSDPPVAGQKAYVVPLVAKPRPDPNAQPTDTWELNHEVYVLALDTPSKSWAQVQIGDPASAPAAGATRYYIEQHALQSAPQVPETLISLAEQALRAGKREAQAELLSRALRLDPKSAGLRGTLFDAAIAAKDYARAAWAVSSGMHGEVLVWSQHPSEEKTEREAESLAALQGVLEKVVQTDPAVMDKKSAGLSSPWGVAVGVCSTSPFVKKEIVELMKVVRGEKHPVEVVPLLVPASTLNVTCPKFMEAYTNNCDNRTDWELARSLSVEIGKQTLIALIFSYSAEDCGDGALAYSGVQAVFVLRGADGLIKGVETIEGPNDKAELGSLEPLDKGFRYVISHYDPSCANIDNGPWARHEVRYDVTLKKSAINVSAPRSKRVERGKCGPVYD